MGRQYDSARRRHGSVKTAQQSPDLKTTLGINVKDANGNFGSRASCMVVSSLLISTPPLAAVLTSTHSTIAAWSAG